MLKVKLAKTAGFCWGVKRALDIVMDVSEKVKGTLYTYGPLIHNPQVIEMLESKNIKVLKDFKSADADNLVIRTHGITPTKRREIKKNGFNINDATCPLVMKVQSIIKRHARKGYSTIIAGDKDHAEVEGLLGFTAGRGNVVESLSGVDSLPYMEMICVVAQTTFDKNLYKNITSRILKRFPDALIFKTTCDTTDERQTEVINLAKTVDAMIVVGGKNSANTARLAQISKASGVPTFFIETEKEIDEKQLNGFQTVGVTAGASTPTWMNGLPGLLKILQSPKNNFFDHLLLNRSKIASFNLKRSSCASTEKIIHQRKHQLAFSGKHSKSSKRFHSKNMQSGTTGRSGKFNFLYKPSR